MSELKITLKNLISLSTAELASRFLTVVYSVYLARVLMVENFGIFGSAKYLVVYFILLSNLGTDSVGTREVAANKQRLKEIVDNLFTMRFVMGLLGYFLLFIITLFLPKTIEEKTVILVFGINILANNLMLNWVFQGLEKMDIYALRSIITNILNFVGILVLVQSPDDLLIATIIVSSSVLFNAILLILYYHTKINSLNFAFDLVLWKDLFRQSYPIGFTFLVIGIYNFLPIVLLSFLSNNFYTGLYTSVINVYLVATLLSTVIQAVYYPKFAQNQNQEERTRTFSQFAKLMFSFGTFVPLFLMVYADKVVMIFGRDYSPAMPSIQIVMVSALLAFYSGSLFCALLAWKYERKVVLANLTGLIVTLVVNLVLIPMFNDRGAAISSVIGEFSVFLVLAIIFRSVMKKIFLFDYFKVLVVSGVSTVPFMFFYFKDNYYLISMFLSIFLFVALIFLTKIITLSDLKRVFNL